MNILRTKNLKRRSGDHPFFTDTGRLFGSYLPNLAIFIGEVMPVQLDQGQPWRGEKCLMAAVLEDALEVYARGAWALSPHAQQLARDAELWICSDEGAWPFSFLNICQEFGLDAGKVREAVLAKRRAA